MFFLLSDTCGVFTTRIVSLSDTWFLLSDTSGFLCDMGFFKSHVGPGLLSPAGPGLIFADIRQRRIVAGPISSSPVSLSRESESRAGFLGAETRRGAEKRAHVPRARPPPWASGLALRFRPGVDLTKTQGP